MSVPFSAGALYTTVGDLNKMNDGIDDHVVLNKVYTALMFKRHIVEVPVYPPLFMSGLYSGYGWDVGALSIPGTEKGKTIDVAMKSGVINGYNNYLTRTDDYIVAMLSNSAEAYSSVINIAITQMLYGAPAAQVAPSLTPSNVLQNTICQSGLPAALAQLKKNPPSSPLTISAVGNSFIGTGMESNVTNAQIDTALALFNVNAATFPTVPLVYQDLIAGYGLKEANLPMSLEGQQ